MFGIPEAIGPLKKRLERKLQIRLLSHITSDRLIAKGKERVLRAFREAAQTTAYRALLEESGVSASSIRSIEDFHRFAPVASKASTFGRFSIRDLAIPGALREVSGVLTSSGHGKSGFAFGFSTRAARASAVQGIDLGLEMAFGTDRRRTLAINCLPMGVTFASDSVCVANVSVREDMALAIMEKMGPEFDQIILFADPLFTKKLLDYSIERRFDWQGARVNLVLGEEAFGESFRSYLAQRMHIPAESKDAAWIASSYGVGELGLNLLFESPLLARMRARLANTSAALEPLPAEANPFGTLPTLFHYDPLRTYIEILNPDTGGFGTMAMTMLESGRVIPLVRYSTGDVARLLSSAELRALCEKTGLDHRLAPNLPVLMMLGRTKDRLPSGRFITHYQDLLYANSEAADLITGAFQYRHGGGIPELRVQLRRGRSVADSAQAFRTLNGADCAITLVTYGEFGDVLTLDYERKFTYACD